LISWSLLAVAAADTMLVAVAVQVVISLRVFQTL
jgi:hypothetical protein